jgi:hypothetical protein
MLDRAYTAPSANGVKRPYKILVKNFVKSIKTLEAVGTGGYNGKTELGGVSV